MPSWLPDPARVNAENPANVSRAALVTVTLFALIVLAPVTAHRELGLNVLGSAALVSLVVLAGRTRRALVIALLIGVPALLLRWFVPDDATGPLRVIHWFFTFTLEIYVLAMMVRHIFTTDHVGPVTLLMSVNAYMMVGLVWSGAFILVEAYVPGSFNGLAENRLDAVIDLYYFSFVTLTTLGYGDISPAAPLARSLVLAEVLCGVMFTAVIVARLISLYREPATGSDED